MVAPYVRQARGVVEITIGSTDVNAGDALYYDGTDWELADATDNTKYAELIATNTFSSGDVGTGCTGCVIVDNDAPYTQGAQQYLSAATAGDITETRPTGAENLMQIIGTAISTLEVHAEIAPPHEVTINLPYPYTTHVAPQDRDNDFMGLGLDDTNAEVGASCMVPQNTIALVIAYTWWCGTGTALDTSDTYTFDVSGGVDDETTSATTDGISAASLAVAGNDLAVADVSAGFDGAGIIKPGNVLGIAIKKAAEGSTDDDPIMLNTQLIVKVV